jgi:hypothetical protein
MTNLQICMWIGVLALTLLISLANLISYLQYETLVAKPDDLSHDLDPKDGH